MSEARRVKPEVSAMLQALREQAQKAPEGVRIHKAGDAAALRQLSADIGSMIGVGEIRPNITELMRSLAESLDQISPAVRFREVGTVLRVGNGVATLSGLPQARTDELVEFPTGVQGLILNLGHETVDVILLGPSEGIQGGDLVTSSGRRLAIPVGHSLVGRVVDPLATPLDERGPIDAAVHAFLESDAPGIVERAPVDEPLLTGWKMIDALVPIGRGQRELIVGDRQTGKTSLAVDAILNQKGRSVYCFYVAIGQKKSTTLSVIETLQQRGAMDYTTVVVSSPDDPPALRYLAPYAGCTMAEHIMRDGRSVLVVYDDLTKHADAYRELSLLLRRPPGREAYPGDIFYLHSRLLERASRLNEAAGGGSLTALPIVETQRGNMSAYIPTNLISITDGQILLDRDLFNRGIKPAVDAGRSVSRVGGAAQVPAMRRLAANLRLELAQYEEVARFARFGGEVDEATQQQIRRGERWQRALTQPVHHPLSLEAQILVLYAAAEGHLDDIELEEIPAFERALIAHFEQDYAGLLSQLGRLGELSSETMRELDGVLTGFRDAWPVREVRNP